MSFDANSVINGLPGFIYSFISMFTSIINSFLVYFGKDTEVYVVALLSVCLGWFMLSWIRNSNKQAMWFVILSLLIFATARFLSIGG